MTPSPENSLSDPNNTTTESQETEQGKGRQLSETFSENVGEFLAFPNERNLASDIYQKGKEQGKKRGYHLVSREMARAQHHSIAQGSLFALLSEKAKKDAIVCQKRGDLLTSLAEGMDGSDYTYKVLIGLCQLLAEQSGLRPKQKDYKKMDENSLALAKLYFGESELTHKPVAGIIAKGDEVRPYGENGEEYPSSLCRFVVVKISDFTRRVKGLGANTKPDTDTKNRVKDVLDELRKKKIYTRSNGRWIWATLIRGERGEIDPNTKEEIRIIELDGIFTKNILHDFIALPDDILERLKGRQGSLTMRLFWYLVEQRSYKKKTYPLERTKKAELLSEIAILERYKRRLTDKENDFKKAVEVMKRIRLIASYKEESSKDGMGINCLFTFSDGFETHPPKPKK